MVMPLSSLIAHSSFGDYLWQEKASVTRAEQLREVLDCVVDVESIEDLVSGISKASMAVRINPYLLSLIDWRSVKDDPIRRQFLPLASEMTQSHPLLSLDSLGECEDSPVDGLVHRYPDRALFLATDRCPVYCRFCTRSYSVGTDTTSVVKVRASPTNERWKRVFDYLRMTPAIADVVISGGDCVRLKADQLLEIGTSLMSIPTIRRIRFATKGLAVIPMKITGDRAWTDALIKLSCIGRTRGVEVSLHTHFNHPREITPYVVRAANLLFAQGLMVRNQAVLLRGVNDNATTLTALVKRLGDLHIHPYYVYLCDPVVGIEDMRVDVATACRLEKEVRGYTAGYNMPAFVVDAPGGGGKRLVHSYERYDRDTGLAYYAAPAVKRGRLFVYPDPLHALSPSARKRWADPDLSRQMVGSIAHEAGQCEAA